MITGSWNSTYYLCLKILSPSLDKLNGGYMITQHVLSTLLSAASLQPKAVTLSNSAVYPSEASLTSIGFGPVWGGGDNVL